MMIVRLSGHPLVQDSLTRRCFLPLGTVEQHHGIVVVVVLLLLGQLDRQRPYVRRRLDLQLSGRLQLHGFLQEPTL